MTMDCEVCQRVRECGVACYPYGTISIRYCVECLRNNAHPRWMLEETMLEAGGIDKMFEGFGEDNYFFSPEDGQYHQAKEIQVTKEQSDKFWSEFYKACERLPKTDDSEETRFWRELGRF